MAQHDEAPVIIVGGGPVGLALAIELAQRNVASIVVERNAKIVRIPKGQNLTQRTMEHFWSWGIERELRAARTIPPEYGIGGLTAYGTLVGPYHYDWLQRGLVRKFYHTDNERLPQYETERVLRGRARELPLIDTRYGWRAEAIRETPDGVEIEIADRRTGGRRALHGAYVVGCDGSRSLVRQAAGMSQTLTDVDRLMVLLVFRSRELHEILLKHFPGKSFFSVLHAKFGGYWQFFGRVDLRQTWFFHAPVPFGTTADNFDFLGLLHSAAGAPFAAEFDHIGFWDLRFAIADAYRQGRAFIAGDAAHSHPPYGGYGINTGFEDVRNLGWKLAATLEGWGGGGLLDSYSLERQPVFASTARDFIQRSIQSDRDFLAQFDPTVDRAAFEAAWATRASSAADEVNTFEPHYEGSPIVFGSPGATSSAIGKHSFVARAGHHLAPQLMDDGRSTHEVTGKTFALIVPEATAQATALVAEAAEARIPLSLVIAGREAIDAYGSPMILVRPDQFVAWSGSSDGVPGDLLGKITGRG